MQYVGKVPATRLDVITLQEQLDSKLLERQVRRRCPTPAFLLFVPLFFVIVIIVIIIIIIIIIIVVVGIPYLCYSAVGLVPRFSVMHIIASHFNIC